MSQREEALSLRFLRFVEQKGLIRRGGGVLACVSGGADSVALLHLLHRWRERWGIALEVAHFDHCLRGEESRRDAAFVEAMARGLGLPFHLDRWEEAGRGSGRGSLQARAREARYRFFRRVARARGLELTATAHTADDQAEELLIRLIRGAGLQGLKGIPVRGPGGVIRPLLFARRGEIVAYLRAHRLEWREDPSNRSPAYLRNRVRHRLIPLLQEEFNPSVVEALCRTAETLAEAHGALREEAEAALAEALIPAGPQKTGHGVGLRLPALRSRPAAVRKELYKLALARMERLDSRLSKVHLDGIDGVVMGGPGGGEVRLPGCRFVREGDEGWFLLPGAELEGPPPWRPFTLAGPGCRDIPGLGRLRLRWRPAWEWSPPGVGPAGLRTALAVAAEAVSFPMEVRPRRPGDRFHPLGREREGSLKGFLMGRRVAPGLRWRLPLLVCRGRIFCVAGVEVAEWARITPRTETVLEVILEMEGRFSGPPR